MRENRPYGLEGGEAGSTGLPYPYACGTGWGQSTYGGAERLRRSDICLNLLAKCGDLFGRSRTMLT